MAKEKKKGFILFSQVWKIWKSLETYFKGSSKFSGKDNNPLQFWGEGEEKEVIESRGVVSQLQLHISSFKIRFC